MSFSEFTTHPNRSTDLFNTIQNNPNSLSTAQKKNSETDPKQQKQRKQLILTDNKNILT